jgi:hypothetical protein
MVCQMLIVSFPRLGNVWTVAVGGDKERKDL